MDSLIRDKEEGHRVASLHESEGSRDDGHYSERSESSTNLRRDRHGMRGIGEVKVDQILECFDYSGRIMVRRLTLEFSDYVLAWWNQVLEDIRKGMRDPFESWGALKRLMRERFVPSYYSRDLYQSVEGYHKEIEMNLMKAQIEESWEATMAQFLHKLNMFQHYSTLEELVHQDIKVELQLKRRNWKGKEKEKERSRRDKSPKKWSEVSQSQKKVPPFPTFITLKSSSIKCLGK
ncbi:hypothetical protein CR513_35188, partial [Mucuna pruriens]